eukprot:1151376-Pelagomonas_calceolata.AAC.6
MPSRSICNESSGENITINKKGVALQIGCKCVLLGTARRFMHRASAQMHSCNINNGYSLDKPGPRRNVSKANMSEACRTRPSTLAQAQIIVPTNFLPQARQQECIGHHILCQAQPFLQTQALCIYLP